MTDQPVTTTSPSSAGPTCPVCRRPLGEAAITGRDGRFYDDWRCAEIADLTAAKEAATKAIAPFAKDWVAIPDNERFTRAIVLHGGYVGQFLETTSDNLRALSDWYDTYGPQEPSDSADIVEEWLSDHNAPPHIIDALRTVREARDSWAREGYERDLGGL